MKLSKVLITSAVMLGYIGSAFLPTGQTLADNIKVNSSDTQVAYTQQVANTNNFMNTNSTKSMYQTKVHQLNLVKKKLPTKLVKQLESPKITSILKKFAKDKKTKDMIVKKFSDFKKQDKYKKNPLVLALIDYLTYAVETEYFKNNETIKESGGTTPIVETVTEPVKETPKPTSEINKGYYKYTLNESQFKLSNKALKYYKTDAQNKAIMNNKVEAQPGDWKNYVISRDGNNYINNMKGPDGTSTFGSYKHYYESGRTSGYSFSESKEREFKKAMWNVPANREPRFKAVLNNKLSVGFNYWLDGVVVDDAYGHRTLPIGFHMGLGEHGRGPMFELRPLDLSNTPLIQKMINQAGQGKDMSYKQSELKQMAEETLSLMVQDGANRSDWKVLKISAPNAKLFGTKEQSGYAIVYKPSVMKQRPGAIDRGLVFEDGNQYGGYTIFGVFNQTNELFGGKEALDRFTEDFALAYEFKKGDSRKGGKLIAATRFGDGGRDLGDSYDRVGGGYISEANLSMIWRYLLWRTHK